MLTDQPRHEPEPVTRSRPLRDRLAAAEVLILDGAIGTELERLGVPMHEEAWCAVAMHTHLDRVREVHRSYIEAGADVITANTYASTRDALVNGGLEHEFEAWNEAAVRIARQAVAELARERPVYVAGSVSTFGHHWRRDKGPAAPKFRAQAEILAAAGADLLLVETLAADSETAASAVEESVRTGLPVWAALSCVRSRETGALMLGIEESQAHSRHKREHGPFAEAVDRVAACGADAILMMHSDLKVTVAALEVMRDRYPGPRGAYPNAGYWLRPQWAFVDRVSPPEYLAEAKRWLGAGARIVGGCCGIGPEHIRALREGLPATA